jgi:hypothetical protein
MGPILVNVWSFATESVCCTIFSVEVLKLLPETSFHGRVIVEFVEASSGSEGRAWESCKGMKIEPTEHHDHVVRDGSKDKQEAVFGRKVARKMWNLHRDKHARDDAGE